MSNQIKAVLKPTVSYFHYFLRIDTIEHFQDMNAKKLIFYDSQWSLTIQEGGDFVKSSGRGEGVLSSFSIHLLWIKKLHNVDNNILFLFNYLQKAPAPPSGIVPGQRGLYDFTH